LRPRRRSASHPSHRREKIKPGVKGNLTINLLTKRPPQPARAGATPATPISAPFYASSPPFHSKSSSHKIPNGRVRHRRTGLHLQDS
jgi:hypothetical protein